MNPILLSHSLSASRMAQSGPEGPERNVPNPPSHSGTQARFVRMHPTCLTMGLSYPPTLLSYSYYLVPRTYGLWAGPCIATVAWAWHRHAWLELQCLDPRGPRPVCGRNCAEETGSVCPLGYASAHATVEDRWTGRNGTVGERERAEDGRDRAPMKIQSWNGKWEMGNGPSAAVVAPR